MAPLASHVVLVLASWQWRHQLLSNPEAIRVKEWDAGVQPSCYIFAGNSSVSTLACPLNLTPEQEATLEEFAVARHSPLSPLLHF